MSPMFGGKKKNGKTVALLDIEGGSVGAALARLTPREPPKLFGQTRVPIPILTTRDAKVLAGEIEQAMQQALAHVSTVAARLRAHEQVSSHGEVDHAALFFSPPWGSMQVQGESRDIAEPVYRSARLSLGATLGNIPTSFHPLGSAAAHATVFLFPYIQPVVLCIVSREVTELLLLSSQSILGRATVPVGSYTLLRTLMTHGGMSAAEAHSYIELPRGIGHVVEESLGTAEDHIASEIAEAVSKMMGGSAPMGIIVMAPEPLSEPLARALTRNEELSLLFSEGSIVRAMRATHAMPYIAAHAPKPDLPLMLEALFINAKFSGI